MDNETDNEIKRRVRYNNIPELLNAYHIVIDYFYNKQGYITTTRNKLYNYINTELKELKNNNKIKYFLKERLNLDFMFDKIPRIHIYNYLTNKLKEKIENDKEFNIGDNVIIINDTDTDNDTDNDNDNDTDTIYVKVYTIICKMKPTIDKNNDILYKIHSDYGEKHLEDKYFINKDLKIFT